MIPNNVGLEDNKSLKIQLEHYQADFRKWWNERGPAEFLDTPMRIRVPTGSVSGRWSQYVEMSPGEYRWGLFMAPCKHTTIQHGVHAGEKLWDSVPSDYYDLLLHHIRIQADVENGGVEQARALTKMAPSFYDLTKYFQFSLEEGRHSWAMVHLLLEHFGHDGLVESEALLSRMCGDSENPRLLDAFNCTTNDWLSHFMWLFLADRDGGYQLSAVSQGAFAPLARAAIFMLYEEPLHINIGLSGLDRTLYKSALATLEKGCLDIFDRGAISLPVIQKYFNYWIPRVLDLFGNDESDRAYNMYRIGIRSPRDMEKYEGTRVRVDRRAGLGIENVTLDVENVLNTIMRRQYIDEITEIIDGWNDSLRKLGIDFQFKVPSERFNRRVGPCKELPYDVDGKMLHDEVTSQQLAAFLPSEKDYANVRAVMKQVLALDEYASWVAPPSYNLKKLVQERVA